MAINTASPGHPVQLVSENEKGDLTFCKAALIHCLEKVKDVPVCIISVAGQQRMGKSFLLNVLLQQLTQAEDGRVMAQEKDPIGGFKSQVCEDTVTKGIWIWSQPCLIDTKSGKVAVFLLDTEGTMDFQQKREKSLKLSAFSILLSSYSIVNVAKHLKETDFEYLELFIDCMEKLQEAMGSQSEPIQQLDLVIRDCDFTDDYSQQDAKQYLANTTQKLEKSSASKYPHVLKTLKKPSTCCHLMPYPGKKLARGKSCCYEDMDEDFQKSLQGFIEDLVGSLGMYIKRDSRGQKLTGGQLAEEMKKFPDLNEVNIGFSDILKMAAEIHIRNLIEEFRHKYEECLGKQESLLSAPVADMADLNEMQEDLQIKVQELLEEFRGRVRGEEPVREDACLALERELQGPMETFLHSYRREFSNKWVQKIREEFAQFLNEKESLLSAPVADMPDLNEMQEDLQIKVQELLEEFRGRVRGEEPVREDACLALERELQGPMETFLHSYRRELSNKWVQKIREEFAQFLNEKTGGILHNYFLKTPGTVYDQLKEKMKQLLNAHQNNVMNVARENLKKELEKCMENALRSYWKKFSIAVVVGSAIAVVVGSAIAVVVGRVIAVVGGRVITLVRGHVTTLVGGRVIAQVRGHVIALVRDRDITLVRGSVIALVGGSVIALVGGSVTCQH